MPLIKLLVEGASPILYHFTWGQHLVNILQKEELNTSNVLGSGSDEKHQRGKFYFLSFQRSGTGKLGYAKFVKEIRIVIDGKTLSNNHKVVPVDYWQQTRSPDKGVSKDMMNRNDEMEDRLITDKSKIKDINKFIKRIDINGEKVKEPIINSIIKIDTPIPIFVYENTKDWENMKESEAVPIEEYITSDKEEYDNERLNTGNIDDILLYIMKIIDPSYYKKAVKDFASNPEFVKLFNKYYANSSEYNSPEDYVKSKVEDNEHELENQIKYMWLDNLEEDWRFKEKLSTIQSFFHNYRSRPSEAIRSFIQTFVKFMKDNNFKRLEDVLIEAIKIIQK